MRAAGWDPLLEALLDLTYERGYEAIAVEDVAERAGVSRGEFERHFASKDECALALFDAFLADYQAFVRTAYDGEAAWPDSMRAAAYAVAEWIEAHPREVRFGTVDMLWAGDVFQAHREAGFQSFIDIIDAGREVAPDPAAIPAAAAASVIGSIAELMTKRLQRGKLDFYALVPQLMYLAVLPYLGEEAAARELTIPPPSRRSSQAESGYRPSVAKRESGGEEPERISRLPRGRHGLPRELVAENQRRRLITAIVEAVAEHGYGATTIAHITTAARLSRRTFYEHFANKEACFAAAYETIFDHLRATLTTATAGAGEWSERVRAGLAALLAELAEHPEMARFFLIAPPGAGDAIADRHHEAMRELVAELTAGAPALIGGGELSPAGEQAIAGGISRLVIRKLNADEAARVPELLPALVEQTLRPFLGAEEAAGLAAEARGS